MKVAHLLFNTFVKDSRVEKELHSIAQMIEVAEICIFCTHEKGLNQREQFNQKTLILRIPVPSQNPKGLLVLKVLNLLVWNKRTLSAILKFKPQIIHCHDLTMLPIGWLISTLTDCSLIYDAHEFETEVQSSKGFRKMLSKLIESMFILKTTHLITVSESIDKNYSHLYSQKESTVILNCPPIRSSKTESNIDYLREKFRIKKEEAICLYQGAFIKGRGIDFLLNAYSQPEFNTSHIVFMGFGDLTNKILEYSKSNTNIHFHEPVSPSQILEITSKADIGICFIENCCKSYYYCLPNKLFEYIQAGVPVIASNMYELNNIINKNRIGLTVNNREDLKNAISSIMTNKKQYTEYLNKAAIKYNWENEEIKLHGIYRKAINKLL